jgi:hypothetical protein
MSVPVREMFQVVKENTKADFQEASVPRKIMMAAMLGGLVAGLAFEWGTGNEALLGLVGSHVLEASNASGSGGVESSAEAAFATGLVSFAEQSILGIGMAINVAIFPNVVTKFSDRFLKKDKHTGPKHKKQSVISKLGEAMTFGSQISIMKDNVHERKPLRKNVIKALGISSLVGAGVVGIVGASAGILEFGAEHGLENQAHIVVNDVLANPLAYLGTYVTVKGVSKIKQHHSNNVKSKNKSA